MNGKTVTLAALAATLMLGTSASGSFAREGQREGHMGRGGPERMFVTMLQELDSNKDGKISKEEAAAGRDTMFTAIDADSDGILTPGEIRKHREAKREERKAAWEARKAEREKEREAAKADAPPAPGEQADAGQGPEGPEGRGPEGRGPGEGRRHHAERGPDRDGPGRHHGWRHEAREDGRHGGPGPRGGARLIRIADTDENGQISKEEAVAMGDRMFERMDTNKDGFISADDLPKRGGMFR